MNKSSRRSSKWVINLSMRVNLLNVRFPYIPFLLKNIPKYINSTDYDSNCVKTVQTIGHIQREGNIIKIIDINEEGIELPICLDQLPVSEIYFKVPRNNCNNIWEYNVVRVYGTLIKQGSETILSIIRIFELKDAIFCEKMFATLSLLSRKGIHQYSPSKEINKLLDIQQKIKRI